ncbi:hypothetical protein [Candidatus Pantoea formicae]|uniref:hypothetical protein n=1 Tax=Candidatus Pantoea formicae TaxID=2608355 RepID=UPI003EDB5ED1
MLAFTANHLVMLLLLAYALITGVIGLRAEDSGTRFFAAGITAFGCLLSVFVGLIWKP